MTARVTTAMAAPTTTRLTNQVDTQQPSVVPPPERLAPGAHRRRRALGWGFAGGLVAVVVAVLVAMTLITTPYVILSPGQTYVATDLVSIAADRSTYPPSGQVRFVTVSEKVDPTVLEKLQADYDGDDDVIPREQIFPPGQTKQQNEQQNAAAMATSKDTAAYVALRKLGYDVPNDVIITEVVAGQGAAAAGAAAGDIITSLDGQPVTSSGGLRALLASRVPGDTAVVGLRSAAGERSVTVTLGDNPNSAGSAFLGVGLADQPKLPFSVNIDTSRVGGPSAGLAFTLAILDVLTPGELTGGQAVAATGEIDAAGNIGAIGGIEQKVVTVERAGVRLFLVPADVNCGQPDGSCNYTDAKRKAGDRLQVVAVSNVDDALQALASVGGNGLALGQPGRSGPS